MLGFADDLREYSCVPAILEQLQVKSVHLMTNNPRKIRRLKAHGIRITGRLPVIVETNQYSGHYVSTKRSRMGHLGAQ